MKKTKKASADQLKAVDFFCSGGGMTCGFRRAGVNVIGGIDIDPECEKTYTTNNPNSKFILSDIKELSFEVLDTELRLQKNDDKMIFIGCSPCQYWSIINTDKTKSKKSRNLLADFQRFVEHYNPGFIVVENVPGLYTTKKKKTPLTEFLACLERKKYFIDKKVINASKYGVPQSRKRFLLVASRVTNNITLPKPDDKESLVKDFIGNKSIFYPVEAGNKDKTDFLHTVAGLSALNKKRLEQTPKNGGTRMAWKHISELQLKCYIDKDHIFKDVYGRMFWGKPGPTITTKFLSISNGRFAHPEQNRAISLREGATLQTFELDYKFISTSTSSIARLIGNAVPPELSFRIAQSITQAYGTVQS